ncbi:hypothetical protein BHM03_00002392 [Ensete ventricosum]|nr:hypothetical protein BHM03_00002392 [Ensete ventricosum]
MAVTVASGILRPSPSTRAVECGLPIPRCCSLRCSLFAAPIPSKIRFCFPRFLLQLSSEIYQDNFPVSSDTSVGSFRSLAANWHWEQHLELSLLDKRYSHFIPKIMDSMLTDQKTLFSIIVDVDIATHIDVYDDGPDRSPGYFLDMQNLLQTTFWEI